MLRKNAKIALIAGVPLFEKASKRELAEVASLADELSLPAGLEGKTAHELTVPGEISLAAVVRGGHAILPTEGTVFEKDDLLHINVARESAAKLERLLGLRE